MKTIQDKINITFAELSNKIPTQVQLAEILSVHPTLISHILKNRRNVAVDHLQKLAKHLDVSVIINMNPDDIEWFQN
jgi:plasmid maintenance system antidote protein VapI